MSIFDGAMAASSFKSNKGNKPSARTQSASKSDPSLQSNTKTKVTQVVKSNFKESPSSVKSKPIGLNRKSDSLKGK